VEKSKKRWREEEKEKKRGKRGVLVVGLPLYPGQFTDSTFNPPTISHVVSGIRRYLH
jgi:hypothetical protein